jgi:hypothetical protein
MFQSFVTYKWTQKVRVLHYTEDLLLTNTLAYGPIRKLQ